MKSTILDFNLPDEKEIEVRNQDNKLVFTAKQMDGQNNPRHDYFKRRKPSSLQRSNGTKQTIKPVRKSTATYGRILPSKEFCKMRFIQESSFR